MTSHEDVLTSYKNLGDAEREQFWDLLYSSGLSSTSPLPPPAQDVHRALEGLLIGASVLGPQADRERSKGWRSVLGGPSSTAALETTATALAKWWAVATAVGGPLAWVVAWNTAVADYWGGATGGEKIAVIASAAATLIAVVIAIAVMVSADLKARSVASAGQYNARAAISRAYLQSGARQPDIAARHLAIQAAMVLGKPSGKKVKVILPGADIEVGETQVADGVLRVRDTPGDAWTPVPSDAHFELS